MTEPGGLAAFFSQPADEDEAEDVEIAYDEPHTTYPVEDLLAAFYDQPSEDDEDEPLHVQADRAQAEHEAELAQAVGPIGRDLVAEHMTDDVLAYLGKRCGGTVTGLVVQGPLNHHPHIVWVNGNVWAAP